MVNKDSDKLATIKLVGGCFCTIDIGGRGGTMPEGWFCNIITMQSSILLLH